MRRRPESKRLLELCEGPRLTVRPLHLIVNVQQSRRGWDPEPTGAPLEWIAPSGFESEHYGRLAQLGEHPVCNRNVRGSNPRLSIAVSTHGPEGVSRTRNPSPNGRSPRLHRILREAPNQGSRVMTGRGASVTKSPEPVGSEPRMKFPIRFWRWLCRRRYRVPIGTVIPPLGRVADRDVEIRAR